MSPYRFCTLYSGSKGNAAYIETPSARILIDAGRCTRSLTNALAGIGADIDEVDAIFITHEHRDHISALEVLCKKHPIPVHMLLESARCFAVSKPEALCRCLCIHEKAPFSVTVGNLTVTAFRTPHDSRASCGYHIDMHSEDGVHHLGYATDIGCVTGEIRQNLRGCEAVVLESNHDTEMLMYGRYPYELKRRISSPEGHLSNGECADLASELVGTGTDHFLLAHLSEENNRPDLAYYETASALAGYPVCIKVASPTDVTMLVGEEDCPIPKTADPVLGEQADSPLPAVSSAGDRTA